MITALLLSLFSAHALSPLSQYLQQMGASCTSTGSGDYCIFSSATAYSQPVVMLIPPGLSKPEALILYLHGHRGVCSVSDSTAPANMATRYKLLEQMREAGADKMVTVFPMSRGSCKDYDNALVPNWPSVAAWAESLLKPTSDKWIVAGHSGAGRAIANILSRHKEFTRRTDAVGLLDAAYSMDNYLDRWAIAAGANRRMMIRSFYATNSPEKGSKKLQVAIPSQAKAIRSQSYGDHCDVPMNDFAEALASSPLRILLSSLTP